MWIYKLYIRIAGAEAFRTERTENPQANKVESMATPLSPEEDQELIDALQVKKAIYLFAVIYNNVLSLGVRQVWIELHREQYFNNIERENKFR